MPSYQFPILVWDHADGAAATACLVEDGEVAAVGPTRAAAAEQVRDLLRWRYRQAPWTAKPSFGEAELTWVKVDVRPEYRSVVDSDGGERRRVFPCRETVTLRLPCVRGREASGLLVAAVPTLGVRFEYGERGSLVELAGHYVRLAVRGLTPAEVARRLPPSEVALETVVVHVPRDAEGPERAVDLAPLPAVADPLGGRGGRGRLSRPWEREAVVADVVARLGRDRGSLVLVGESGTGKSAVLAEAVRQVERQGERQGERRVERTGVDPPAKPGEEDDAAAAKVKHRFWRSGGSRLVAGMKYLGQWQQRCEAVVGKLDEIGGTLCVDRLLDLVQVGGPTPGESVAAFLVPYVQRGEVRLVGEATAAELDACRRLLPAFAAALTVVPVPELTPRQAVEALAKVAGYWGQNLRVAFDPEAVEQAYRLFSRFLPYQGFPGRAANFVAGLFDAAARDGQPRVTVGLVVERFVRQTGLPERFLRDELPLAMADVAAQLGARVAGQPAACRAAAAVVTTFKAGMNDPGRPLGVLLFCGPTGVGKTELARAMSDVLFGAGEQRDRLVRLDLSEYAGPGAAARLVSSPDGEPAEWVRRVREQPFTVVLLDEVEKASADVYDVLLGVFDEGRLSDRFGRVTTFRSAVLILTSNLGAGVGEPFGLSRQATGPAAFAAEAEAEVAGFFRPEFFNRLDAVVPFDPLDEATVGRIAVMELGKVAAREGLRDRGLALTWTDAAVAALAAAGYDRRYGARPLQRTVEQWVVTPLSRLLVDRPGLREATVVVDVDGEGVVVGVEGDRPGVPA